MQHSGLYTPVLLGGVSPGLKTQVLLFALETDPRTWAAEGGYATRDSPGRDQLARASKVLRMTLAGCARQGQPTPSAWLES